MAAIPTSIYMRQYVGLFHYNKPCYDIYILINDGHNQFTQKYFYPINGCYKAIARDYEGDGNLGIATIAFFADYKDRLEERLIQLKSKYGFRFTPLLYPKQNWKNGPPFMVLKNIVAVQK